MANRDELLVSTDWLAAQLDNPGIRVVEVDEDTDAYARGHIPGAVAVNWNTDLQDPLRRDFIAFHDGFPTELGICVPREYLLSVGVRR